MRVLVTSGAVSGSNPASPEEEKGGGCVPSWTPGEVETGVLWQPEPCLAVILQASYSSCSMLATPSHADNLLLR